MVVQLDTRAVQVQQVKGHGFKSTAGDWLNVSKYANPGDVAMPSVGDHIVVHLDRAGFVRKVEAVVPAPASVTPESPMPPTSSPTIVQDDRGVVITRLACINAATAILATGGGAATPDEVLALAGRLEDWATR